MDLRVGGRIELVVLHCSALHELLTQASGTQLDDVQLLAASIEPPEH